MLPLWRAARGARNYVRSAVAEDGMYRLTGWWRVDRPSRRRELKSVASRLRMVQRISMGFLDPLEDAIFLTEGLRRLGFDASFHLGRELVPVSAPSGFYAWVSCGDEVVSTSVPVREEYVEVYRSTGA